MIVKQCKCGLKKKEVPCAKDYTCDVKCKKYKDCRKHTCNRKCCDGTDCPSCDQQCNKTLACKNHKCTSRCHQGGCYPCTLTKEVACNCGTSRILVPCGMERSTKPPRCKLKCKTPPNCHHRARIPHACHFGICPSCKQICNEQMKCGHSCPNICHDQVLVKIQEAKKAAGPWEVQGPKTEFKNLACPECQFPVAVTCLGGHETAEWPCSTAKPASCGRKCGRLLPCGNHSCLRDCHKVKNALDGVRCGSNCRKCEAECLKSRPEGCSHPCLKACHPKECDPCAQIIRIWCHCAISQLYVKCGEWIDALKNPERRLTMACCTDQCPKLMSCGHRYIIWFLVFFIYQNTKPFRCVMNCHPGECSDRSKCKKKAKLYCPCKRRKQETLCNRSADTKSVLCDEDCKLLKEKVRTSFGTFGSKNTQPFTPIFPTPRLALMKISRKSITK